MNSKILCTWLGLVAKEWPPDPYALLGLKPGENDLVRIEKTVQDRMAKLRCYQLSHPDEATEGMNRVAQAFISLMEAAARSVVKRPAPSVVATATLPAKKLTSQKIAGQTVTLPAPSKEDTLVSSKTEIDWKNTPPPVRLSKEKSGSNWMSSAPDKNKSQPSFLTPVAVVNPPPNGSSPNASAALLSAPVPAPEAVNVTIELAQQSPEARRGLGTFPALIERIYSTRQLLTAWQGVGRYVSQADRRLTRPTEDIDLIRRLHAIFEKIAQYPPILGRPGKPGYRVVAMAHLEMTAQMFKMLDETQREDLARDWHAGHRVLLSHRRFLRQQFKALRKHSRFSLVVQAIRSTINDYPGLVLTGILAVAAVSAAVYFYVR